MKKVILIILLFIGFFTIAQGQERDSVKTSPSKSKLKTVRGFVHDKDGQPLPGITIKEDGTANATTTDMNGLFKLTVPLKAKIVAADAGYNVQKVNVQSNNTADINMDGGSGGGSFSPNSYWVGASVGYNVNQKNSSSANSIVGGASVSINPITSKSKNWSFGIVGNIGNFVSSQSGTNTTTNSDLTSNISKLSQSASGLNVGIATTYTFPSSDTVNKIRLFGSTKYQLNSFQNVGDTTSIGLSQWKNTIGIEYEGWNLQNGGKFHAGLAGTIGFFDTNTFQQIFLKKRSSIASLDASIILPLSSQFGFLLEGTYTQYTTPVYLIGIVIRTTQAKK